MLNAMLSNSLKATTTGSRTSNILNPSTGSSLQQRPLTQSNRTLTTNSGNVNSSTTPVSRVTTGTVNVTTSILQSTLSQAPTLLHTQLMTGSGHNKSPTVGNLSIDNKAFDADSLGN